MKEDARAYKNLTSIKDDLMRRLAQGQTTTQGLEQALGCRILDVRLIIKANDLPVRFDGTYWSLKGDERTVRRSGDPLIRNPVTNGVGGCHALV